MSEQSKNAMDLLYWIRSPLKANDDIYSPLKFTSPSTRGSKATRSFVYEKNEVLDEIQQTYTPTPLNRLVKGKQRTDGLEQSSLRTARKLVTPFSSSSQVITTPFSGVFSKRTKYTSNSRISITENTSALPLSPIFAKSSDIRSGPSLDIVNEDILPSNSPQVPEQQKHYVKAGENVPISTPSSIESNSLVEAHNYIDENIVHNNSSPILLPIEIKQIDSSLGTSYNPLDIPIFIEESKEQPQIELSMNTLSRSHEAPKIMEEEETKERTMIYVSLPIIDSRRKKPHYSIESSARLVSKRKIDEVENSEDSESLRHSAKRLRLMSIEEYNIELEEYENARLEEEELIAIEAGERLHQLDFGQLMGILWEDFRDIIEGIF
ncbi:hypothetical protein G9A89_002063 [Geosiphon pyriformis]|nr:hypothetical protein G9A89_002063 [Geosiphon pyriformis]